MEIPSFNLETVEGKMLNYFVQAQAAAKSCKQYGCLFKGQYRICSL